MLRVWLLLLTASACAADLSQYERIVGHGRYMFVSEPKTWFDARKRCEQDGATLAVLNDYDESVALRQMLLQHSGSELVAHVGFHDLDEEGNYTVLTGGTLNSTGFNVWKNPPTGSAINEAKDCGGMWICGRLADVGCEELLPYICELP